MAKATAAEGDKAAAPHMSIIKVQVMRMATTVVDRAIQVHGALGVTEDTPLERMYRHARFARIYDGADEVHKTSLGRRLLRQRKRLAAAVGS